MPMKTETKSFSGNYLLFRKKGGGLRSGRAPRFRHPNFASAEKEAKRLLEQHPESTFVILQEVARVKAVGAGYVAALRDAHEIVK